MVELPGNVIVYTTKDWEARSPREFPFPPTLPTSVIVHHMANQNVPVEPDHHKAIVLAFSLFRNCQNFHMDTRNWSDTGQNFTITRSGIIGEGRTGSLAALLAGHCIRSSHAADLSVSPPISFNSDFGIEHEGTYDTEEMPAVQWNSSVKLLTAICTLCKIDSARILGHRDTGIVTDCPGELFSSQLPLLRKSVHQQKLFLLER